MRHPEQQLKNVFRYGNISQKEIDDWLRDLRGNPSPRESNFDVTAIGQGITGGDDKFYFAGVNAEQLPHRLSTHGEDGVIAALATGLGKYAFLQSVHVMAAPRGLEKPTDSPMGDIDVPCCGKCRQNIFERAANPNIPIRAISLNGKNESIDTISNLLVKAFGFADFNAELQHAKTQGAEKIAPPTEENVANRLMRFDTQSEEDILAWLNDLQSAAFASGIEHTVIIRLSDGTYVAGAKSEDAAYTGISAVQAATAIALTADGYHRSRHVQEVWFMAREQAGKILTHDRIQSLPLSDVQILLEFGAVFKTPIHIHNAYGKKIIVPLDQTIKIAPTFDTPTFECP